MAEAGPVVQDAGGSREGNMNVRVIGAGFGRTGTLSTKAALERLGFAPCHHMTEVFSHPGEVPTWHAAARGVPIDWRTFLSGYGATIDWPSCHFWRQLAGAFPDARVLLTVRDPESWWTSFSQTILAALQGGAAPEDPALADWPAMVREIISEQTFGGRPDDRDIAIAAFRRRTEEVKAAIPSSRLLVFEARQGWQPLCDFLGVETPDEPFPRVNDTAEFKARPELRLAVD